MAKAMVQVNVRVEPGLYRKVKRRAKLEKVTVQSVVSDALKTYIADGVAVERR